MSKVCRRWTPEEDQALKDLMHEHLGARFTDIALMATAEGGPIKDRTVAAVVNHLSIITGRTTWKPKAPAAPKDQAQEDLIKQLQAQIEALQEENEGIRHENERLRNRVEYFRGRGKGMCWAANKAVKDLTEVARKLNETANSYIMFYDESEGEK